jgi:hypothetical protein
MLPFGSVARKRLGLGSNKPKSDRPMSDKPVSDKPLDAAWIVLEAANDLGDKAAVEACRRVIDASLNGTPVSQSDLHVVSEYFR